MSLTTKHLVIAGEVQGVGFRYSLWFAAQEYGITGWVRNKRDGSVEAVVQGDEDSVRKLIEWTKKGPEAARVNNVFVTGFEGQFKEFSIRETN